VTEPDPHSLQLTLTSETEVVMTRTFDAPRALVFEALTRCERLRRWCGTRGARLEACEADARPGGSFRIVRRAPDGGLHPFTGRYREVDPPSRLGYSFGYAVDGRRDRVLNVTVTLREHVLRDGGPVTVLTSTTAFADRVERDAYLTAGLERDAAEGYDRLSELLVLETTPAAEDELVVARLLDAPPDVVFAAWTELERLARWWGPAGFELVDHRLDLRPGGTYRYGMRPAGGRVMWGKLAYREIQPPERLVYLSAFTDQAGATVPNPSARAWPLEVLNTLTFFDGHGRTMLVLRGRPEGASASERAAFAAAKASVSRAFEATFDQLQAYLVEVAADR